MKMLLVLLTLLLCATPVFAQNQFDQNSPNNHLGQGMALYDQNGNYHGQLGGNPYNPNSTSNPNGRYGNQFSPDSINNPNANFGAGYRPGIGGGQPANPTNPNYNHTPKPYGAR